MSEVPKAEVGILSIPRYLNYGTQLQAFALQQAVASLGYSSEHIDYDFDHAPAANPIVRMRRLISRPWLIPSGIGRAAQRTRLRLATRRRNEAIADFRESHLRLTRRRYRTDEDLVALRTQYDAFVVGSDQVWNPNGHLRETAFFLPFAPHERRIAYAPSIGLSELDAAGGEWIARGVSGIPHLSVREDQGAEILMKATGRLAEVVVDPTMLLQPDTWSGIAGSGGSRPPYLLAYFLQDDAYARVAAGDVARQLGLKVVSLPFTVRDLLSPSTDCENIADAGPQEFLQLVRDAAFVCTDSFHGTVFSVLFRRPFFAFRRYDNRVEAATFSRMTSLLSRVGLLQRVMDDGRPRPREVGVDFTAPHRALGEWREKSTEFLRKALASACATPAVSGDRHFGSEP